MKAKVLVSLILVMFIFSSCWKGIGEILPVGEVEIFLEDISFQDNVATISLRFKEIMGVESLLMCLMVRFKINDSFSELQGFSPDVLIPRFGEISWIQKVPVTEAYKEADVLRITIQLQTEYFKGFSESKDFNIKMRV